MRKRSEAIESPANTIEEIQNGEPLSSQTQKASQYELSREQRIKENLERMQKLGILDLSLKLKSVIPSNTKRNPRNLNNCTTTPRPSPAPPSGPTRRSSRLKNGTPVSYAETEIVKKRKSLQDDGVLLEEGSKPEVYTEEHEKRLGNTEKSWTLFVDGYGKDGKRIYDQVRGKTCHQCRQKTLGYRTQCCKCNMVQGQFCGDCLYMRYGEHVLEALQNPNWICPPCRGICNCSLCRQAKGWPPTGTLYKKISKLGFKSVAHYLIQTRRLQTNLDKNADVTKQVSAKRSLPFSDVEVESEGSLKVESIHLGSFKSQPEAKSEDKFEGEKQTSPIPGTNNQVSARRSLPFSDIGVQSVNLTSAEVENGVDDLPGLAKPQTGNGTDDQFKGEKEKEPHFTDKEHGDRNNDLKSSSKLKKKHALPIVPSPDSIAGILRQKRRISNDRDDKQLPGVSEKIADIKQDAPASGVDEEEEMHSKESVDDDNTIVSERSPKHKKPAPAAEPSHRHNVLGMNGRILDIKQAVNKSPASTASIPASRSIAGRLRQKRRIGNGHDDKGLPGASEKIADIKQDVTFSPESGVEEEEMPSKESEGGNDNIESERSPKQSENKSPASFAFVPAAQGIAGRLRSRCKTN
ncbi:uncharacterized protein LOC115993651 [Quercus lobata]|uniref:Zinc-finger domain-containing protein n=1 Tax=Quercus lobata TaxID=97700 RepID=A0A7N2LYS5_QUELO|nr:uncharacterized protein LOC115993651 [Quercus lobata]